MTVSVFARNTLDDSIGVLNFHLSLTYVIKNKKGAMPKDDVMGPKWSNRHDFGSVHAVDSEL